MRLTDPLFWERTALPVVIAFGAGVLAHDLAGEHRAARELRQLRAELVVSQEFADACHAPVPRSLFEHAYAVAPEVE